MHERSIFMEALDFSDPKRKRRISVAPARGMNDCVLGSRLYSVRIEKPTDSCSI